MKIQVESLTLYAEEAQENGKFHQIFDYQDGAKP